MDDQVIVVTRKTAIVRHILSAETSDNNQPGRVKLKVMLVFVKLSGHWKLIARQAVKAMETRKGKHGHVSDNDCVNKCLLKQGITLFKN